MWINEHAKTGLAHSPADGFHFTGVNYRCMVPMTAARLHRRLVIAEIRSDVRLAAAANNAERIKWFWLGPVIAIFR